jgi:hypothetical protein
VNSAAGWQTISLATPVNVTSGQKVWLAWVFENKPYVRYQATGIPGSVSTISSTWPSGMPSIFGSNFNANYEFSVYCTFTINTSILKGATVSVSGDREPKQSSLDKNSFDYVEDNVFLLYPNPSKSFINVDYFYLPKTGTKIIIIDGYGKTILTQVVESTTNRIDIKNFPAGLYFVKSINQNWNNTKKLIIRN